MNESRPLNSRPNYWKLILILMLGLTVYLLFSKYSAAKPLNQPKIEKKNPLGEVVTKSLEGATGTYGIAIKNLKTGESYYLNEHQKFDTGSLYKVWVMVTAYQQIEQGVLDKDESIEEDVADLNRKFDLDPEVAELNSGSINFTVSSALKQMITISHNYAAMMIIDKVQLSKVKEFVDQNGLSESSVGIANDLPKTTAFDMAAFFEKLYKGELASPENTQAMLDLLKGQQLNDKLPKLLPTGTVVAHKTGEIEMLTHDGGIVFSPKGDYIIVVMSESKYPPGAMEKIAEISKAVFDYFEGK